MTLNLLKLNMTPSTFEVIFGSVQVTLIVLNNQFFKIYFRGLCGAGNADHNNHRNVKRQFPVILTDFRCLIFCLSRQKMSARENSFAWESSRLEKVETH